MDQSQSSERETWEDPTFNNPNVSLQSWATCSRHQSVKQTNNSSMKQHLHRQRDSQWNTDHCEHTRQKIKLCPPREAEGVECLKEQTLTDTTSVLRWSFTCHFVLERILLWKSTSELPVITWVTLWGGLSVWTEAALWKQPVSFNVHLNLYVNIHKIWLLSGLLLWNSSLNPPDIVFVFMLD